MNSTEQPRNARSVSVTAIGLACAAFSLAAGAVLVATPKTDRPAAPTLARATDPPLVEKTAPARPIQTPAAIEPPSPGLRAQSGVAPSPEPLAAESAHASSEEHDGRHEELPQTPAWKGEKTRAILQVVTERAKRIESESAELERAGETAATKDRRVLLARLKKQLSAMNDEIAEYAQAETSQPR